MLRLIAPLGRASPPRIRSHPCPENSRARTSACGFITSTTSNPPTSSKQRPLVMPRRRMYSSNAEKQGARKMSEIDALIGKAGEPVPIVDVADMKAVWAHGRELRAQHPGGLAVELDVWKQVCGPGA